MLRLTDASATPLYALAFLVFSEVIKEQSNVVYWDWTVACNKAGGCGRGAWVWELEN